MCFEGGGSVNARPERDPKFPTRPPREKSKVGAEKRGKFSYLSPFLPKKEVLRVGMGFEAEEVKNLRNARSPCQVDLQTRDFESGSKNSSNPYSKSWRTA